MNYYSYFDSHKLGVFCGREKIIKNNKKSDKEKKETFYSNKMKVRRTMKVKEDEDDEDKDDEDEAGNDINK